MVSAIATFLRRMATGQRSFPSEHGHRGVRRSSGAKADASCSPTAAARRCVGIEQVDHLLGSVDPDVVEATCVPNRADARTAAIVRQGDDDVAADARGQLGAHDRRVVRALVACMAAPSELHDLISTIGREDHPGEGAFEHTRADGQEDPASDHTHVPGLSDRCGCVQRSRMGGDRDALVGGRPSIIVVDAHAVMASALAIALRHSGFDPTLSIHPDELELELGEGVVSQSLTPGDTVLLGLLYGDGRSALPLIRPLADRGCRVIVMTVQQGLPLVGECLRLGAEGVLNKEMSFEKLVQSLRRLVDGGEIMTVDDRCALLESVDRHQAADLALARPFSTLTGREAEVLGSLVDGSSPKQIAHRAGISISTVRGHIQRTLMKLDVSSQREALAMAREAGWPPVLAGDVL